MKMKRNPRVVFSFMLVMVLLASLLAGCNSTESADNNTETPATDKPAAEEPAAQEPAAEEPAAEEPQVELEGKLNITLPQKSKEVWQAVADAYMEKHPKVEVTIDIKPSKGYKEWLTAQFAAGVPEVDLAVINEVVDLQAQRKFVNFYPWFEKMNPYTGKPWKESFNLQAMGINLGAVGADDVLYTLNFESVQILWIYNKEIFAELGVNEPPKTFNELIDIFQKARDAGYTPLALSGDAQSIWSGQAGWLMRIYPDQYFRDSVNLIRSQPQDYTYVPEIDDIWTYDVNDPYNDSNTNVTKNPLRVWKAIKEKQGDYAMEGNPKWKASMENLKTLFSYTPDGFFGVNDDQAYKLFLTGRAATMLGAPASYWQLPKDFADEEKTGAQGGVKPFEFGFFNMPSMEGELVQAPAQIGRASCRERV